MGWKSVLGGEGLYKPGSGGGMVYPGAGIPLSTGIAWDASIANNSADWNTAFGWGNHAGLYLKLDQTAPQTVINGAPSFENGIETPYINYNIASPSLGIGKTSPAHRLDVKGHIRMSTLDNSVKFDAVLGAAGNITDGSVRYVISYVTSEGETNVNWAPENYTDALNPVDQKIELSNIPLIPLGSADVTQRKLYRTIGGGYYFFFLANLGLSATTYSDNLSYDDLLASYYAGTSPLLHIENTTAGFVYLNTSLVLGFGENSTFVGLGAGNILQGGLQNTIIGGKAGQVWNTTNNGSRNVLIGDMAGGQNLGTLADSVFVGSNAGFQDVSTGANTFIGSTSGQYSTTGTYNTFLGYYSGRVNATGSHNIYLGAYAGTPIADISNTLLVDSFTRVAYANYQTDSIIYGVMAAHPADQSITFNVGTASFGAGNLSTTGTLGAGVITGTSLTDGSFSVTAGTITGASGSNSLWTNDEGYITSLAFADLTDYPVNAAGALTNNGVGGLSWEAGGSGLSQAQVLIRVLGG